MPKCGHPLVVVVFSLHFCLRNEQQIHTQFIMKFLPALFSWMSVWYSRLLYLHLLATLIVTETPGFHRGRGPLILWAWPWSRLNTIMGNRFPYFHRKQKENMKPSNQADQFSLILVLDSLLHITGNFKSIFSDSPTLTFLNNDYYIIKSQTLMWKSFLNFPFCRSKLMIAQK